MSDAPKVEPALGAAEWAEAMPPVVGMNAGLLLPGLRGGKPVVRALVAHPGKVELCEADGMPPVTEFGTAAIGKLLAILNAALPDNDARKITQEWVADERQAYHDAVVLARHYQSAGMETERQGCIARAARHRSRADALASYLPPE